MTFLPYIRPSVVEDLSHGAIVMYFTHESAVAGQEKKTILFKIKIIIMNMSRWEVSVG